MQFRGSTRRQDRISGRPPLFPTDLLRAPRHRRGARSGLCLILSTLLISALAPVAVAADEDTLVAKGKAILEEKCMRCHAIGPSGESPHAKAPPFRTIVKRYPVEDLAEALAEGIVSGHPDMPVFTFEPADIDAILAYLGSLNVSEDSN